MAQTPHILIATPVYGESVTLAYTKSLFRLQKQLRTTGHDLQLTLGTSSSTSIETARNYFASHILENPAFTHLLFVDADHGFPPNLILDMLGFNRPVVGVIYPAKQMNYPALWRLAKEVDGPEKLQTMAASYVLPTILSDDAIYPSVVNGFVKVSTIGTGIMLIQRHVFERMADLPGLIAERYEPLLADGLSGRLLQCFRPLITESNLPLGEDLSFCKRWVDQCSGEIWANVSHQVQHVGPFTFEGRFMDRLAGRSPL